MPDNYSHTPGPWKADHEEAIRIRAADGTLATLTHLTRTGRRDPEEVAANARLIAAAPALLDAIQYALDVDPTEPAGEIQPLLARAALIAAEG